MRIVTVCRMNQARSPFAQAVLERNFPEDQISSTGVTAIDGTPILYAVVEIAPLLPQREEPGRAPARPVIDESQPHQYVIMIRDLGTKRQPAFFITVGSTIIFLLCCLMLHRRDKMVAAHVSGATTPAKV